MIDRAVVTASNLHYVGSLTLDPDLMEAARILPHEKVQVVDAQNGARLDTYVITGRRGSGEICLNGAAARLVHTGDRVTVIAYAVYSDEELSGYQPTVVVCGDDNRLRSSDGKGAVLAHQQRTD